MTPSLSGAPPRSPSAPPGSPATTATSGAPDGLPTSADTGSDAGSGSGPVDRALRVLLRDAAVDSDADSVIGKPNTAGSLQAAAHIRRTVADLIAAQDGMTDALIMSQDRLLALRALTQVQIESLGGSGATERVLDEALELTDSDAVVLLGGDGALHVSGNDLAATKLVLLLAREAETPAKPGVRAVRNGRAVVARLVESVDGAQVLGFIRLTGRAPFSTGDIGLIESVASAANMMHTLTRLHLQGIQRATIDREHQFASSLAQAVLEVPLPRLAGADLFARTAPASLAGGDFMTFMDVGGVLWFAVGDVAGKGLPAAMVMTRAVSAARVAFLTHCPDDAIGALLAMGTELFGYLDEVGLFVTAVVGAYHPRSGRLHLCNAGHSPVLIVSASGVHAIPASMPPLGILEHPTAQEVSLVLAAGDALILGSDGLAEQENAAGELFGYDRLRDLCARASAPIDAGPVDAARIGEMIFAAVANHAAGTPPSDDCTLAVLCADRPGP